MDYGESLIEMVKTQLPWRITRLREIHGFSQQDLAQKTRLAPATISQLEGGVSKGLQLWTLIRLAAVFEVTLDYMAGIDHAPLVRQLARAGHECPECGTGPAGHSVPDCMVEMHSRGRSFAFIGARFGFSVPACENFLREEYRMRRERSNRKTAGQS